MTAAIAERLPPKLGGVPFDRARDRYRERRCEGAETRREFAGIDDGSLFKLIHHFHRFACWLNEPAVNAHQRFPHGLELAIPSFEPAKQ